MSSSFDIGVWDELIDLYVDPFAGEQVEIPTRATRGSAGYDLYVPRSSDIIKLEPGRSVLIPLGFRAKIREGCFALIKVRSGLAGQGLWVNAGVIDEDYRGEWKVLVRYTPDHRELGPMFIKPGERIAQAIIIPYAGSSGGVVVRDLSEEETGRGSGGFGSTGR